MRLATPRPEAIGGAAEVGIFPKHVGRFPDMLSAGVGTRMNVRDATRFETFGFRLPTVVADTLQRRMAR